MIMTAYLIAAATRRITAFEYEEYAEFKAYLPGGICIGAKYPNGDILYVDDEALLRKATVAFRIKSRRDGQPMMSNGVLTGFDDVHRTRPPAMTVEQLTEEIEWLDIPEALNWFRVKAATPAFTTKMTGEAAVSHAMWSDFLLNLEGGKGFDPRTSASLHREFITRPLPRRH